MKYLLIALTLLLSIGVRAQDYDCTYFSVQKEYTLVRYKYIGGWEDFEDLKPLGTLEVLHHLKEWLRLDLKDKRINKSSYKECIQLITVIEKEVENLILIKY